MAGLESIHVLDRVGQRWQMTLAGVPGWCWEYPLGLCVALAIERPSIDDEWLVRSCLWLASMHDSLDDSLLLEGERLFLVRSYKIGGASLDLEARINQQLAIVSWFANCDETQPISTESNVVGRLV